MDGIISKRYGRAMFELAKNEGKAETYLEQLQCIKQITLENPDLLRVFDHPKVTMNEKLLLVDDLFTQNFDKEVKDFLKLLVTKDRISSLLKMIRDFEELYYEYKNIVLVKVTSAEALIEEEKEKLLTHLKELFRKEVIIEEMVDPSILGGLLIEAQDKVIDATVKGSLEKVRHSLLEEVR